MATVGTIFREERERLGLSISHICNYTRISKRYLIAIESDRFELLPSLAHAKAYMAKYADLLQLSKGHIMDLFEREYVRNDRFMPVVDFTQSVFKKIARSTITITTKQIFVFSAVFLCVFFFWYIFSQISKLLAAPLLSIDSPKQGQVVTEPFVIVKGQTIPDAMLYINSQEIQLDIDKANNKAYFEEKLELSTGFNQKIIISAQNKVSRASTEKVITINNKYTPSVQAVSKVFVNVLVEQDTKVTIQRDDEQEKHVVSLKKGGEERVSADRVIIFTVTSGGAVTFEVVSPPFKESKKLMNIMTLPSSSKPQTVSCTASGCMRLL